MRGLKIAICGAGPAGLAAAIALHRAQHDIHIFDQFEKPMPLGSGLILQPTGLAVLDWLGLGPRMRNLGARIDRLFGKAENRVVLDVQYAALGNLRGLAVHRAGLFNVLHDCVVAQGQRVNTSHKIKALENKYITTDEGRRLGPFDLIIDALGSRSPLIPWASAPDVRRKMPYGAIWASLPWPGAPFDENALEQRYERAAIMAGVLPIGRQTETSHQQTAFFWSLKTAEYQTWQREGLNVWKNRVQTLWPETAEILNAITDPSQLTMASYHHHTLPLPYGQNLVFIGDSAHSTSPQLGQGANMALMDVAVLTHALEANSNIETALAAYAAERRGHIKLYQALSLAFTPFYQSDSSVLPMMRDYLVPIAARLPPIQKLLANIVSGHLGLHSKTLALISPSR